MIRLETERTHILDTDIFGDPDDLAGLFYLLAYDLQPTMIVTVDELGITRAEMTRELMDSLCMGNVDVFPGVDLGNSRYICWEPRSDSLTDSGQILVEISERLAEVDKITYLGFGPLTNLARILDIRPEIADKLDLIAMAGSWDPVFSEMEHNVKLDMKSTSQVIQKCQKVRLITADYTVHEQIKLNQEHNFIRQLNRFTSPVAKILRENFIRFHERFYPDSYLHDALAASVLIGRDFVRFRKAKVGLSDEGLFITDPTQREILVSDSVDYEGFMEDFTGRVLTFLQVQE